MKNKFDFILIKPQLGENIGACARSLKNFGFSKLSIVSPKQSWPNHKAKATSVGAYNIIKKAKIYDNTHDAVNNFIGEIEQYPPIFSALKKDGKRLYEFARSGESVDIKPRKVAILEFEITSINNFDVSFRIKCSKGTYIRSIANDFGKILNTGGHLINLRRTKIGEFDVSNALNPTEFIDTLKSE